MKPLFLIIFVTAMLQSAFSQLNPIQNLDWYHTYPNQVNTYSLTWETPETSSDNLVGYNVYRNDEVYRFQTDTAIYYGIDSSNAPQDFLMFDFGSFYIHVTAVYNDSTDESGYIDSVHCGGVIIGLGDILKNEFAIYPNPAKDYVQIQTEQEVNSIEIINMAGQVIHKNKQSKMIDINKIPQGTYVLKASTNKGIKTEILIKEEE
ncbi:MAG: T9SS type A sorting domain-containing protein [Salinivirgaceae bacterium]|jgi:hypothetical protein|nr:T9SS type A sorting domain-containing protein [Salinivirgaceae bacterium]